MPRVVRSERGRHGDDGKRGRDRDATGDLKHAVRGEHEVLLGLAIAMRDLAAD